MPVHRQDKILLSVQRRILWQGHIHLVEARELTLRSREQYLRVDTADGRGYVGERASAANTSSEQLQEHLRVRS